MNRKSNGRHEKEEEEEEEGEFVGIDISGFPTMDYLPSNRPPCLEVRHRPISIRPNMKERAMVMCLMDHHQTQQLWLGMHSQLRMWSRESFYAEEDGGIDALQFSHRGRGGVYEDEDTPLFGASVPTSCTLCLVPDAANMVIWSGHGDGKVKAWPANGNHSHTAFEPRLAWQAHRGPVLSMVITSYGELWTGSENGALKAWPCDATTKALDLAENEQGAAASNICRSFVDLRKKGTPVGSCGIPNADVRFLLSEHSTAKVWTGGFYYLELWDAQTRNVLKIFGTNAHGDLCCTDFFTVNDNLYSDKKKTSCDKISKKEKKPKKLKIFKRSKNILKDAAETVLRVGSTVGDGSRKIEFLALSGDQMFWVGYSCGLLVKYSILGKRIQEFKHMSLSIESLCYYAAKLWIGYLDGRIEVLEQDGTHLGGWKAHSSAVVDIAVGGGLVYTLSADGSIRGWPLQSPGPLDMLLRSLLVESESLFTRTRHLKVLSASWNVAQERATCDSLISWLASPASEASIVVIGLQEMEMGAGFLAMSAAKESVGIEVNTHGQWWSDTIGKILDEGTSFERIASRQLAGLLVVAWIRKDLQPYVGDVKVGAVACGIGRRIGNKGAVALKMRLFRKVFCVVNCHLAAHKDAIHRRNADFEHVYHNMTFNQVTAGASGASFNSSRPKSTNDQCLMDFDGDHPDKKPMAARIVPEETLPELATVDVLIWLGDLNYRLDDISYEAAIDCITHKKLSVLLRRDQLRREMIAGRVFPGMREGIIKFPPTYKYDKGESKLVGFDSSEKRRVPAWCDRILFRDSRQGISTVCNLSCPVVASVAWYDACMDVKDSDHKPLRCMFNVDIADIDENVSRREFRRLLENNKQIKSLLALSNTVPETVVSANSIALQESDITVLRVTNTSEHEKLMFEVVCGGEAYVSGIQNHEPVWGSVRCCFGFPRWLQVIPASGFIDPGRAIEIAVYHEDMFTDSDFLDGVPQNSWCEDHRSKEVMLLINVRRCGSSQIKQHQVVLARDQRSKLLSPTKDQVDAKLRRNLLQRATSFAGFKPSETLQGFENIHST